MGCTLEIPALGVGALRQEDGDFEASLSYIMRSKRDRDRDEDTQRKMDKSSLNLRNLSGLEITM